MLLNRTLISVHMGKHFDRIIDLMKKKDLINDKPVRNYLEDILNRAALFDFPLNSEKLRPKMDMTEPEYIDYMRDFFETSRKYGSFFLMPFEATAIEDPDSVVIMDRKKDDEYIVTVCEHSIHQKLQKPLESLQVFSLRFDDPMANLVSDYNPIFDAVFFDGKKSNIEIPLFHLCDVVATGALAFMKTSAYIMDPENFIIRREANHARKKIAKNEGRKKNILRKTDVRPHYICMGYDFIKNTLENEKREI
jgi:hypothetical protein